MSKLFDNYINKATNVPYNDKVYLKDIRDTKDVIVIGASNDHVFEIPFKLHEMDMFWITYIQGTEVKITKKYYPHLFKLQEDGTYKYAEDDSTLIELNENQIKESLELEDDPFNNEFLPTYSVLFYTLTPDESLLFNDYNKEVYVELKAAVNTPKDDLVEDNISFSKRYKLKIIGTLRTKKPSKHIDGKTMFGFGYTED